MGPLWDILFLHNLGVIAPGDTNDCCISNIKLKRYIAKVPWKQYKNPKCYYDAHRSYDSAGMLCVKSFYDIFDTHIAWMANALTCAWPGTFFCLNVFSHVLQWNDEVAPQVFVCSFKCMTQA